MTVHLDGNDIYAIDALFLNDFSRKQVLVMGVVGTGTYNPPAGRELAKTGYGLGQMR